MLLANDDYIAKKHNSFARNIIYGNSSLNFKNQCTLQMLFLHELVLLS